MPQLRDFAHVRHLRLDAQLAIRHLDPEPVLAHRGDVRRPLLDKGHIATRGDEIRADRGAVGPRTHDRDARHRSPSPSWTTARDIAR